MIHNGSDVVSFLREQHQDIKAMFESVIVARGERRAKAFYALRRMLAVHETAEEEIIHPVARRILPNGDALVDARLQEENGAKQLLAELENLDVDSPEFERKILTLRSNVIAHAHSEEREEFTKLGRSLDQTQLSRMRTAAEFAEQVAPTRPHAGVESRAANILVGPFASMIDRTRDALTGKK
jgi:hemerythrin superfamily protein